MAGSDPLIMNVLSAPSFMEVYLWGRSAERLIIAGARAGKDAGPVRFVHLGSASAPDITAGRGASFFRHRTGWLLKILGFVELNHRGTEENSLIARRRFSGRRSVLGIQRLMT
jgi:hypothetical protein